MTKKATHRGECQVCGRLQKLPGDRLSLHGYTVMWNVFNGTCWGAGHLPLEVDKTLVVEAIARVELQKRNLVAYVAAERARTGVGGWVHVFVPNMRTGRGSYEWRRIEFYAGVAHPGNPDYVPIMCKGEHVKPDTAYRHNLGRGLYGENNTPEAHAAQSREEYAKSVDREIEQLTRYINWQTDRLKVWQSRPLAPVKEGE
jgi:hypothetical protein